MKIVAIFGKEINPIYKQDIESLFNYLSKLDVIVQVYRPYFLKLQKEGVKGLEQVVTFTKIKDKKHRPNLFVSIGGDGTFLDSTALLRESNVPIIGVNTGRLGFLARVSSSQIKESIDAILANKFHLESRSMLRVDSKDADTVTTHYGLNEVTVHKNDNASMIIIHTYVNGEFLNSYWADGIIISTPTGSTAYSLSVGGPIVAPGSNNFIIAPIAPHNLNVRPMVISDNSLITLKIESRTNKTLLSVDSRISRISSDTEVTIKKSTNQLQLVTLEGQTFFKTLRHKLNWGLDKRN